MIILINRSRHRTKLRIYSTKIINRGIHWTWKPDQPARHAEIEPPPPELTNPIVGGGSPPTELDTFGSVGRFPPQKPNPPDPTIKSTKFGDIQRFSDKNLQISAIFLLFRRRATWNPPDPTRSRRDLVQIQ